MGWIKIDFTEKAFQAHKEAVSTGVLQSVPRGDHGLLTNEGFVIRHYAGQVLYHSEGFLQKNNNSLHEDLDLVLKSAEDPFLKLLFAPADSGRSSAQMVEADERAKPALNKSGSTSTKRGAKTRFSSVSGHFVLQLSELTSTLASTNSHFVRCVNPNKSKMSNSIQGGHVLHQLRCSGMMEALRLMHSGFPTRCPYEDLYDRYKDMMPRSIASLDSPSFCEILLMALGLDRADYQLGITKVFFRAGKLAFLDALTGSEYKELAPDIANKVRVWLIKKRWRRHTIAVVAFLRLKATLADLRLRRQFFAAVRFLTLMANKPLLSVKRARQIRWRNAALRIQAVAKGFVMSTRYHKVQWATRLLERTYRGHMARKRNGGRLAEIRANRKAEEDARRLATLEEQKAREKEEMERIKEVARTAGSVPLSTQSAAKYNSKSRPGKESSSAAAALAPGSSGRLNLSEDLETRLRKLEAVVLNEMLQLKKRVQELEEELARTKQQLASGGLAPTVLTKDASHRSMRTRVASTASLQPAVAAANAGRVRRQSTVAGKSSWGLLDLLGISQGGQTSIDTDAGTGTGGQQQHGGGAPSAMPVGRDSGSNRRQSVSNTRGHQGPIKLPAETLAGLQTATKQIARHFSQANIAGTDLTAEMLGNDQKNKDIAVLVRGQLCTALSRVLLHGFKSYKLIGRYHIWDFVQESCEATKKRLQDQPVQSDSERTLLAAVVQVNSHEGMGNNPNIKFRSFVCCGLNHKQLHAWVRVLRNVDPRLSMFD